MTTISEGSTTYKFKFIPRDFYNIKQGNSTLENVTIEIRENGTNRDFTYLDANLSYTMGIDEVSVTLQKSDYELKFENTYSIDILNNGSLSFRGQLFHHRQNSSSYKDKLESSINDNEDGSTKYISNTDSNTEYVIQD